MTVLIPQYMLLCQIIFMQLLPYHGRIWNPHLQGRSVISKTNGLAVGEGLAPPEITVKLKPCGEVVKEQLQLIETRFPSVSVEDYVIMPDHIHAVIFLHEKAGGASPSPTNAK